MKEFIKRREKVHKVEYRSFYENKKEKGAGFSFVCDKEGNLLGNEYATKEEREQQAKGLEEDPRYKEPVIQEVKWSYVEPAVIECDCGEEVVLHSSLANTCEKCDREYNMSGQLLAPRHQWGVETGETFHCNCESCQRGETYH